MKRISKPQRLLFSMVKKEFSDAKLNFRILTKESSRWLDIALLKLKIDIEYDEPYWHKDNSKDERRDKEIREAGWKIIRINNIDNPFKVMEVIRANVERIKSIQSIGEQTVGDFIVPTNKNLVMSSGIVIHNTETHAGAGS